MLLTGCCRLIDNLGEHNLLTACWQTYYKVGDFTCVVHHANMQGTWVRKFPSNGYYIGYYIYKLQVEVKLMQRNLTHHFYDWIVKNIQND